MLRLNYLISKYDTNFNNCQGGVSELWRGPPISDENSHVVGVVDVGHLFGGCF